MSLIKGVGVESTKATPSTSKPVAANGTALSRDRILQEKVMARIKELEFKLPELEKSPEMERAAQMELKKLQLVGLQRRLRTEIRQEMERMVYLNSASDIDIAFKHSVVHAMTPETIGIGDKVERPRRIEQNWITGTARTHAEWLATVLNASRLFHESLEKKNATKKRLFKRIQKYQFDKERREAMAKEKLERDRFAALKRNDEAEYLKLLEQTKNKRLLLLIQQTDQYLEEIGEKVLGAQEAADNALKKFNSTSDSMDVDLHDTEKDSQIEPSAPAPKKPYYTRIHRIQEPVESQPTILVGGELKAYQMDGLSWLVSLYNNRLNGILADEMGLGKTIQTIALITHLVESKNLAGPYLIVVPLSTLSNWALEFQRWAPSLYETLVVYKGVAQARKRIYQTKLSGANAKFNVCITTFDYVIKDRSMLAKIKWAYVIVDEGHRMKNHNCKLSTTLAQHYDSQFRLILTGTPLQNSLPELWSLLNFLLPTIFHSVENFEQWFNKPFANTGEEVKMNEEESLLVIQRLHKVLRPFLLRRLKTQVEAQLPEKIERVIKIDMSAWQRKLYDQAATGIISVQSADGSATSKAVLNSLVQLRKICDHPYLFKDVEDIEYDDMLWRSSGKLEFLDRILPKLKATGHRVLMFSQFTSAMDILEIYFKYRDIKYLRLDGSTKADDRGELLAQFNAPDSPYFMFILSTRAGGLGLNLQTADTVILFDSDWNPQADLQAQDRAHRIGQKNDVLVLRLVTQNSIEEKILEAANYKLDLDSKIIQAGMFNKNSTATDRRDYLMNLLKENDQDENELTDIPDNKQINQMISRSDREYKIFQQMDRDTQEEEKRAWLAAGNHLPVPPRLMSLEELPDYMKVDLASEKLLAAEQYGRGRRAHAEMRLDLTTDEEFMKMVADEEEGNPGYDASLMSDVMSSQASNGLSGPYVANDDTDFSSSSSKKRKAPSLSGSSSQLRAIMTTIWAAVRDAKDVAGYKKSVPFMDLPSEDIAPGYYTIIKQPMCLNRVKQRIPQYPTLEAFYADMMQIFANAHIYNVEGSPICQDADFLRDVFLSSYHQLQAEYLEMQAEDRETPNTDPAAQTNSTEPKKFKFSFGKRTFASGTTSGAPSMPKVVSKPITMKVPTEIIDSEEEDDDDDGFADRDLRGTGATFEDATDPDQTNSNAI
jgi:ATP-dependent helicase STH1/SNF2